MQSCGRHRHLSSASALRFLVAGLLLAFAAAFALGRASRGAPRALLLCAGAAATVVVAALSLSVAFGARRAVGFVLGGELPEGEALASELSRHTSGCTMPRCFRRCLGGAAFRVYSYPGAAEAASESTPASLRDAFLPLRRPPLAARSCFTARSARSAAPSAHVVRRAPRLARLFLRR